MKKWIIAIISLLLVIVSAVCYYIYQDTLDPLIKAEAKASEIAKSNTKLQSIEHFSIYNGKEVYYIVEGKNNFDTDIYVIINKETEKVYVRQKRHGLTKEEAVQKVLSNSTLEDVKVQLGMENDILLWEISYINDQKKLNYFYIDFETGELFKKIENL